MLDHNGRQIRLASVDREDRAMLRSNPSARSMPGDGQEHIGRLMLLPSHPSLGSKAINLLTWCAAPTKAKQNENGLPVGHMSVYPVRHEEGEYPMGALPRRREIGSVFLR
jgi:hypothetical protein